MNDAELKRRLTRVVERARQQPSGGNGRSDSTRWLEARQNGRRFVDDVAAPALGSVAKALRTVGVNASVLKDSTVGLVQLRCPDGQEFRLYVGAHPSGAARLVAEMVEFPEPWQTMSREPQRRLQPLGVSTSWDPETLRELAVQWLEHLAEPPTPADRP